MRGRSEPKGTVREKEEPPNPQRMASVRTRSERSSSQDRGYQDFERDVNEGTINVLWSIQAKFMTMQGQTGKNSGYPYFDGTLKEYPKFCRRWHTFQNLYHSSTPQKELVNLFSEHCLDAL